jgi:hypothetical protein
VTLFDSVGFALEDFSALQYVMNDVVDENSPRISLLPALEDPKDLYGFVKAAEKQLVFEPQSVVQQIFQSSFNLVKDKIKR